MSNPIFEVNGYTFGEGQAWRVADWDRGERDVIVHDSMVPNGDGLLLGRDTEGGPEWMFTLKPHVAGDALVAALRELRAAWQGPRGPLESTVLRIVRGGEAFRVYGRPRGFSEVSAPYQRDAGWAQVVAQFRLSDPLHYDDAERSVSLGVVPASRHGLVFPATAPFGWASMVGEPPVRAISVGGDAPSPLVVTFRGPVSRPWVRVGEVLVQVTGDLAWDESLTVDARAGTIRRGDGAAWVSMLSPRTRLADLRVPPGSHDVSFGGVDVTGTATAEVAVRDAWRSL